MLEFFLRNRRRIQKCSSVFAAIQKPFLVKPIERRHQSRIRDFLFKGREDIAHADFAAPPGLVQHLTLKLAEGQRGDLARPSESAQKKPGRFHVGYILVYGFWAVKRILS